MDLIKHLLTQEPLLALFITISLGYLVGKIKVGSFVLGGIAGTLLVGVVIGQLAVNVDSGIKSIFFALFIYAVGFQGGPQFFHALNRRSLNQLASSFVMCVTGLLCVLIAAWAFGLDRGMAAGLAAGGLTQSAIIGTAGDAIAKLGLSPALTKTMQTNVAVGYAVCYIFGSLGPIIMVTWFLPMVMKWDIRQEAVKLANVDVGRPCRARCRASSTRSVRSTLASTRSRRAARRSARPPSRSTASSPMPRSRRSSATRQVDRTRRQGRGPARRPRRDHRHRRGHRSSDRRCSAARSLHRTALTLVQESREIVLTNERLERSRASARSTTMSTSRPAMACS